MRLDAALAASPVAADVPPVDPADAVKTTVLPPAIVCDTGWLPNAGGLPGPPALTASVTGTLVAVPAVFETVTV